MSLLSLAQLRFSICKGAALKIKTRGRALVQDRARRQHSVRGGGLAAKPVGEGAAVVSVSCRRGAPQRCLSWRPGLKPACKRQHDESGAE